MSRENITQHAPQRYQIPTHLKVPDRISLSLLGLSVEITMRQGLICLLGGSIALLLWRSLRWLSIYGTPGAFIHTFVPGLIIAITLLMAMVRIADRPIETWLAILLEYAVKPKIYIWQSIVHDPIYRLQYRNAEQYGESGQEEEEV